MDDDIIQPTPTNLGAARVHLSVKITSQGSDSQNQVTSLKMRMWGGGFEFSANQVRGWVEKQKGQSVSFILLPLDITMSILLPFADFSFFFG